MCSICGCNPFDSTNARYASVVMTNPGGTGNPARAISPELAPLPPATANVASAPAIKFFKPIIVFLSYEFLSRDYFGKFCGSSQDLFFDFSRFLEPDELPAFIVKWRTVAQKGDPAS